ncbi:MAG: DinB family protein [Acidobacteria bacterium]|nr:DinB family protein [Acidobacteriota bacterium]
MKKTEIEERVRDTHAQLAKALEGLTEEQGTRVGLNPEWSVRDALAHTVAWEIQGANIVSEIQAGTWKPQRLNKEMIDDFNAQAVEERRERSFGEVRDEFDAAHNRMQGLIATLPDEIDESSPTYKFIEGVTFRHMAHHAAQIEEWKQKQG